MNFKVKFLWIVKVIFKKYKERKFILLDIKIDFSIKW